MVEHRGGSNQTIDMSGINSMANSDFTSAQGLEATRICKKCSCKRLVEEFPLKLGGDKVYKSWTCRVCVNKAANIKYAKTDEQRLKQAYRLHNLALFEQGKRECKDCRQVLSLDQFRKKGKSIACRCYPCQAELQQKQYADNHNGLRDRLQAHGRKRRLIHGPRLNEQKRVYVAANRQKVTDRQNRWAKEKLKADPMFALKKRLRSLMSNAFRFVSAEKLAETEAILGCTFEQFKAHIEKQFLPGMSWDSRSDWHLDHIVPMATAETPEDVMRLNHFTNYRPLWATDNISKGAKVLTLL